MRSAIISTRHSAADARLGRWSVLLSREGPHKRFFLTEDPADNHLARARRLTTYLAGLAGVVRRHDVCVLPDPDLHLAYPVLRMISGRATVFVLDVHEDYNKTLELRRNRFRWFTSAAIRATSIAYRSAKRHRDILVVASDVIDVPDAHLFENGNLIDPASADIAKDQMSMVYIGDLTVERGANSLLTLARELPEATLHIIGRMSVSEELADQLQACANVRLHGEMTFDRAEPLVASAIVGLSLLQDRAPYRNALPTKLFDYLGLGLYCVVTPLDAQSRFVRRHQVGLVLPSFDIGPEAVAEIRGTLAELARGLDERTRARARQCYADRASRILNEWAQLRVTIDQRRAQR